MLLVFLHSQIFRPVGRPVGQITWLHGPDLSHRPRGPVLRHELHEHWYSSLSNAVFTAMPLCAAFTEKGTWLISVLQKLTATLALSSHGLAQVWASWPQSYSQVFSLGLELYSHHSSQKYGLDGDDPALSRWCCKVSSSHIFLWSCDHCGASEWLLCGQAWTPKQCSSQLVVQDRHSITHEVICQSSRALFYTGYSSHPNLVSATVEASLLFSRSPAKAFLAEQHLRNYFKKVITWSQNMTFFPTVLLDFPNPLLRLYEDRKDKRQNSNWKGLFRALAWLLLTQHQCTNFCPNNFCIVH